MPKMKTHKGTAKRIRATGSGKLVRKIAGASHIMAKKSRSRKRRLKGLRAISPVDQNRMKAVLGHAAPKERKSNDQG